MAPRPVLTCARLTGALLTGALGLAACLPDLDEPAVCPTPAVEPLGDCDGVAVVTPQVGCYDPAQIACLRPDCSCRPDACPTDEGACYPDGDCPPLVRDEIGVSDAVCRRLEPDSIGIPEALDPAFHCTCGCADCMSVCDGRGPVFAVRLRKGMPGLVPIPPMNIEGLMPDAGRLGVYVRARGIGALLVAPFTGDPDVLDTWQVVDEGGGLNIMTLQPRDTFGERVFFRTINGEPYSWDGPEDKPTVLLLTGLELDPEDPNEEDVRDLFVEIDCVVPFHAPLD